MLLNACEGARGHEQSIFSSTASVLVQRGLPAVLAMQGNVTMQTVAEFMPIFFRELQRDGLIDRAVSVARGSVRERPDWWVPVLFMRLKSGRLWYAPGFAEGRRGLEKWPALLRNIRQGRCTPILGPGLTEFLLALVELGAETRPCRQPAGARQRPAHQSPVGRGEPAGAAAQRAAHQRRRLLHALPLRQRLLELVEAVEVLPFEDREELLGGVGDVHAATVLLACGP